MGLKLFLYDSAEYDFDDTYEYNFNAPAKNNFDNAAGSGRRPAEGLVHHIQVSAFYLMSYFVVRYNWTSDET